MNVVRTPEPLTVAIGFVPVSGAAISFLLYPSYLDIQALLIAFLGSICFVFSIYCFSWIFGIKEQRINSVKKLIANNQINFLFLVIFFVSLFGSINLVISFVESYGFSSLFLRVDLFQSNSIINSYGYLLYLNVFIFALFGIINPKQNLYRAVNLIIFIFSILFLIFAGNKSYFFQSILLFVLLKANGKIGPSVKWFLGLICMLVFLFFLYDKFIDLVESDSVFDRPIAYIFGGWATLQSFINDGGYSATYIGDHLFFPIIKIFTFGDFDESYLFKFFDISGFDLNQFSIFGSAFLDFSYFGVIFVGVILGGVTHFLRAKRSSDVSGVWAIIYWYFIAELLLSFFFANMFGGLYVYTSIFIILTINYTYLLFFKPKIDSILG